MAKEKKKSQESRYKIVQILPKNNNNNNNKQQQKFRDTKHNTTHGPEIEGTNTKWTIKTSLFYSILDRVQDLY